MSTLLSAAAPVNNNPPRPPSPLPPPQPLPVTVATPLPQEVSQPLPPPPPGGPQALSKCRPINMAGQRVLLVGDSLGVGVGPVLEKEFRNLGAAAFKNISVGGKTIGHFSDNKHAEGRSLEKALAEYKPTLVFICLGTNDEAIRRIKGGDPRYFTPENYAKNLVGPNFSVAKQRRKAIARLAGKLSGVRSIWLGPPPSCPQLWPMDREFRNLLASTWSGNYFNTEAFNFPKVPRDDIHYTGKSYKDWGAEIARWLKNASA